MKKLIVNADDLGSSDSVNQAIVYCMGNGMINSTSIMPNMPRFEEAVRLMKNSGYLNCVGVHVNLTEGKPLTSFRHSIYLNEDGSWNKNAVASYFKLGFKKEVRNDFADEILAQIQLVEKYGIKPTHINSHHHIHTLPTFFPIFFNLCRKYQYKLRIAQTYSSGNYIKSLYRKYMNNQIRRERLNFSDYFETVGSYNRRKEKLDNGVVEIMMHPAYNEKNELFDVWEKENLFPFKKLNEI